MPTFARYLEICLYGIVIFVPFLLLSIHVFQKFLRFSKPITTLICVIGTFLQINTRIWAATFDDGSNLFVLLLRLALYTVLFLILFDAPFGKLFFILVINSNMINYFGIVALCLENLLWGDTHDLYCLHCTAIVTVLLMLTIPTFYFIARKIFYPLANSNPLSNEWNYYWLVPTVFYVIWQFEIQQGNNPINAAEDPFIAIFLTIVNIGAFLIYYLVGQLLLQQQHNLDLKEEKYYEDLTTIEYRSLQKHIEETRRAKHDLRHHVHIVSEFLKNEEYEELKEYVKNYQSHSLEEQVIRFCPHRIINALMLHFATEAQAADIDFQVHLSIPESLSMEDNDISVLLGNLLENAVQACAEMKSSNRKIAIVGKTDEHHLYFTIDNTFENKIKKNKNGEYLTTKKQGSGIGIRSAAKIIEHYGGVLTTEQEDGIFYTSFMLKL